MMKGFSMKRWAVVLLVILTLFLYCLYISKSAPNLGDKTHTDETWITIKPAYEFRNPFDIIDNEMEGPIFRYSKVKRVLLWTTLFGSKDFILPLEKYNCPIPQCIFTSNRELLSESDAVVFHLRDTHLMDLPPKRYRFQRWVLLNHESPNNSPKDTLVGLNGKINWTITYRLDSDINLSPMPLTVAKPKFEAEIKVTQDFSVLKTNMVVWFVSNCKTDSNREGFVKELQKTITVDVVGDCGNKACQPKMSSKCYEEYFSKYRFYLSFENSICKDYVTEKFFNILDHNIIPVVFGGCNYSKMAPPGSYINALDFESPKALGDFLLKLADDHKRYNEYFEWRKTHEMKIMPYPCQLCQKLHNPKQLEKIWLNLGRWWFQEGNCQKWPFQKINTTKITLI